MAPQFEEDVFVDVRRLGCGSYGEVWEVSATHLNGMRFARKRLPIRNASDARHTIAEIRLLYLCAHKNIIPLYDVYLTDRRSGRRVLAMSNHVDTTTRVPASLPPHARTPIEMRDATFLDRLLQVLLSVSPESTTVNLLFPLMDHDLSALIPVPSEAHAAVLAREILEGLIHLHHHGITHRDIKASNVFVCRCTGRVVLGDLGAAALSRTHQRHHTIIGSPHWMAPEVIAGAENGDLMRGVVSSVPCAIHSTSHMTDVSSGYSQSADVWSFGILMIELLTGSAPHRNVGTRDELFNAILNDPAPSLPQRAPATDGTPERGWVFTDKCRDFVARCTMKDSTRRPSATDLRNDPFLVEHAMIRVTDLYSFYDSPQHVTTSSAVAPEPMQHVIQLSGQFTRTLTEVTCTEYLVLSKQPMGTGPTNTLVGQCNPGAASSIWDETTATLSTTTSTSTMRSSHPGTREEVAALFSEVLSLTHELQHTCPQLLCHWAYHILNTEPEVRAGLRPAVPSGHPDFWSDKPGVVEAREYFPTPTTRASPRPREQHSNTPIDDGNVDSTTRTNLYFLSGVELMPCALPPTQGQVHTQIASYLYSRWWDRVARQGRGTKNNT